MCVLSRTGYRFATVMQRSRFKTQGSPHPPLNSTTHLNWDQCSNPSMVNQSLVDLYGLMNSCQLVCYWKACKEKWVLRNSMVKTSNYSLVKCLSPATRPFCNFHRTQVECVSEPVTCAQCNVVLNFIPRYEADPRQCWIQSWQEIWIVGGVWTFDQVR